MSSTILWALVIYFYNFYCLVLASTKVTVYKRPFSLINTQKELCRYIAFVTLELEEQMMKPNQYCLRIEMTGLMQS